MAIIAQKLKTIGRTLFREHPAKTLAAAARRNLRLWRVARHRGKTFSYRTGCGDKFVCIPGSATSVQQFVGDDHYEEVELTLCMSWLQSGDACLDVGANIGQFAVRMARAVTAAGFVLAVEPGPDTVAHLRTAIAHLGLSQVRIEPVCVSDSAGEVEFQMAIGQTSDVEAAMKVNAGAGGFRGVSVPSLTLNDLIERHGIGERLALVKIDIEGAEPLALRGGNRIFDRQRLPLIVIEIHRAALGNFGFGPADVFRFFPAEHFDLYHVQRSRSDLTPRFAYGKIYPLRDPAAHPWPWYSNLIAVPRVGDYAKRRSRLTLPEGR
jgi:FkbM family methyltransferase